VTTISELMPGTSFATAKPVMPFPSIPALPRQGSDCVLSRFTSHRIAGLSAAAANADRRRDAVSGSWSASAWRNGMGVFALRAAELSGVESSVVETRVFGGGVAGGGVDELLRRREGATFTSAVVFGGRPAAQPAGGASDPKAQPVTAAEANEYEQFHLMSRWDSRTWKPPS
jgi:hypothetical protein